MEEINEFDIEAIRLKRLLDDKISQVERENWELIKKDFADQSTLLNSIHSLQNQHKVQTVSPKAKVSNATVCGKRHSVKSINKSHSDVSHCCKQHSDVKLDNTSPHSRMHFLNHMEHSLLRNKKKNVIQNETERKYIPYDAEVDTTSPHSRMHFINHMEHALINMQKRVLQNEAKSKYFPCAIPLSPPIRIKKEENMTFLDDIKKDCIPSTESLSDKLNRPKANMNKKLVMQTLPGVTLSDEKIVKSVSVEAKSSTHEIVNEPYRPALVPHTRDYPRNTKIITQDLTSPKVNSSVKFIDDDSLKKSSHSVFKNNLPDTNLGSALFQAKEEGCGFNLNVSLDSSSTKDLVTRFLQRIPDLLDPAEVKDDIDHELASSGSTCNRGNIRKSEHGISSDVIRGSERLWKGMPSVESSIQTDHLIHDGLCEKPEFRDLVKDIVVDTLKHLKSSELYPSATSVYATRKVDSGIQSDIESDIAALDKNDPCSLNKTHLNNGNFHSLRASIAIQANMESVRVPEKQSTCDQNINTSFEDIHDDDFQHLSIKEQNVAPSIPPKIEQMIEKLYEHICEKNMASNNIEEYDRPLIRTREVAVQFNPLHTLNKSTMTSDVKTIDSSTQHETTSVTSTVEKLNASVQVSDFVPNHINNCCLQVNAYTQYDSKSFRENAAQTNLNAEIFAPAASLSSTPVSDSMFMDDLISEGEIPLPWNLRLLSSSSGGVNVTNAESSDASTKEKDYSLSEGEVHPNILCYLNFDHSSNSDEHDMHFSNCGSRHVADSKVQYCTGNNLEKYLENMRNYQYQISGSSVSEGEVNSNASLSLGEIPPVFRIPVAESSRISDTHPSCCNCGNNHCDQMPTYSLRVSESGISAGEIQNEDNQENLNKLLQTVTEEDVFK